MATLRITKINEEPSLILLKVEGSVAGNCIGLLEQECIAWLTQDKTVQLDFSGVTFVDPQGVNMLRNLWWGRVHITHCPDFISQLLKLDEQDSNSR